VYLTRFDEGVATLRRAVALDPLSARAQHNLALALLTVGRYDEAEVAERAAIELQPQRGVSRAVIALAQVLHGQSAAAIAMANQETDASYRVWALALAYNAHGDRSEADAALDALIAGYADESAAQIAEVYALRRQPDEMFRWLDHAYETRDAGVVEVAFPHIYGPYRDDPRYISFARKVGVIPASRGEATRMSGKASLLALQR
jgi:tetratricopeptide (TPR) repeat protein